MLRAAASVIGLCLAFVTALYLAYRGDTVPSPDPSPTLTQAAAGLRSPAPTTETAEITVRPEAALAHYSNATLKVELDYPSQWVPKEGYELGGMVASYHDASGYRYGFFQIEIPSQVMTLDDAVQLEVGLTRIKPYGEHPTVLSLMLPAGQARLILPEEASFVFDAALIIPYPSPLRARVVAPPSGASASASTPVYNFFILRAQKDHINFIAETIRFTE